MVQQTAIYTDPLPASRRPIRLVGKPREILCNHEGNERLVYRGFCPTAPMYHMFACTVRVDRPPLIPLPDDEERPCTAGRKCVATAAYQSPDRKKRYCERHAKGYDLGPCPYKVIFPCPRRMGLNLYMPEDKHIACPICEEYED